LLIASVCLLISAWCGLVSHSPTWDDYAITGGAWLGAGLGASILFRLVAASVSPERFLPRWLAIVLLTIITIGVLWLLLILLMASAWGP